MATPTPAEAPAEAPDDTLWSNPDWAPPVGTRVMFASTGRGCGWATVTRVTRTQLKLAVVDKIVVQSHTHGFLDTTTTYRPNWDTPCPVEKIARRYVDTGKRWAIKEWPARYYYLAFADSHPTCTINIYID